MSSRKLFLGIIFLLPLTLMYMQCLNNGPKSTDPRGDDYAGAKTCVQCHKDIYTSYLHSAHYMAAIPTPYRSVDTIVSKGVNEFVIDQNRKIIIEKHTDGFYQTLYANGKKQQSQRIDITLGYVKSQTFVYWKGGKLFQLPLAYSAILHKWTTNPGYTADNIDFKRSIGRRCLECHASYITELTKKSTSFQDNSTATLDKNSLVYSVDCERCHGPAANHVRFHTEHPGEKTASFIKAYQTLSRAQKIDMCAVCHSGNKSLMLRSTFGFKPGDTLSNFKEPELVSGNIEKNNLDVHGNQTQLLQSSKCYLMSKMDCISCHNPHNEQRGNLVYYAQKCISCHSEASHQTCKMTGKLSNTALLTNCIQCHMPAKASGAIAVQTSAKGKLFNYSVYTHHIAVYADETQKVLAMLGKKGIK